MAEDTEATEPDPEGDADIPSEPEPDLSDAPDRSYSTPEPKGGAASADKPAGTHLSDISDEDTESVSRTKERIKEEERRVEDALESVERNASPSELYRKLSEIGHRSDQKSGEETGSIEYTYHDDLVRPEETEASKKRNEEINKLMLEKDFSVDTPDEKKDNEEE